MARTKPSAKKRAENGAQYMDRHVPNWANSINLIIFTMEDVRYCVLGQHYVPEHGFDPDQFEGREKKHYFRGLKELALTVLEAKNIGLHPRGNTWPSLERDAEKLTEVWQPLVKKRQHAR